MYPAGILKPTDVHDPDYFHKVVDCQWACPAHTPVPEYIRLIAAGRLQRRVHGQLGVERVSRESSVARATGRASRPAGAAGSRRTRRATEPVAICRLKRVAADYKDDVTRPAAAARRDHERQAHRLRRRRARPR